MKRLLGITGNKGSGKDTIAEILEAKLGYEHFTFAGNLKEMLRTLLTLQGLGYDLTERILYGDLKEMPLPELCGQTGRHAMQTLGTEWGRQCIGDMLWVNSTINALKNCTYAVVSDVRFANEAQAIREAGGKVIRVTRRGYAGDSHASETEQSTFSVDASIANNGSKPALLELVLETEDMLYG